MTALSLTILALLSLAPGRYTRHLEQHHLGPHARAEQLADYADNASRVSGQPVATLVALWYYESTLNATAVSKAGAEGIGQLHPKTTWFAEWSRDCALDAYACEAKAAEYSALALRHYVEQCGSMARALTAYRTGRCSRPGPRALQTMRLAKQIEQRLREMQRPLLARRLP